MTTAAHWFQGARPRTLGAAVSPVLVGTAVASRYGDVVWWRAGFCLLLAVALQVGVNYANDYSDGVRGVDTQRRGPVRLVAGGLAAPKTVKRAALLCFAAGGLLGIVLAVAVDWRLIIVGAVSILAAGLYSGGPKPYASSGLGEVMVLVFFGFVATCGSTFVHLERVPWLAVATAVPVGLLACAILLVNNLRDVDSDRDVGKRTLAVRVGKARTRMLYRVSIVLSVLTVVALASTAPGALLALVATPLAVPPLRIVATKTDPPALVQALIATARLQLVFSALLAGGLAL
jgi:1,4-dihydroxy-2-naphthoate octaprenyltransferase